MIRDRKLLKGGDEWKVEEYQRLDQRDIKSLLDIVNSRQYPCMGIY